MFAVFAVLTLAVSRVGGVLTYQGSPVSGNVLITERVNIVKFQSVMRAGGQRQRVNDDAGRERVALVVPFGCKPVEPSRFKAQCTTACTE